MRTTIALVSLFAVVGCAAPTDLPASSGDRVVVGHVRMRGRTIDLTVESVDARGGDPELRRATARHEAETVWAGTDDRFFERDRD